MSELIPISSDDDIRERARLWHLETLGTPFSTHSSKLLAATRHGWPVMLKITNAPEEIIGSAVLEWWGGAGAVEVLDREGNAVLMERPTGRRSLLGLCLTGDDAGPIDVLCGVIEQLHTPRNTTPPEVASLNDWCADLLKSNVPDPDIQAGRRLAVEMLQTPRDLVMLHGDIHHRNVLDGEARGWLAIDPKGIFGERAFEYVNIFRNPTAAIASDPAQFQRRVAQICARAQLDRARLLQWIAAFCALSICWDYYPDGQESDSDRTILALALAELGKITV